MTSSPFVSRYRNWLFPLFLLAATFIAYHPAWRGEFLWDDYCVPHGPYDLGHYTWKGMLDIWFHPTHQYYPLTYTSCWLEYHIWGFNTMGFHLVNILLHALSSILLWIILRRLSVPGAWLAAAIFALHPVNVESVAWISERKNTLSCFFFLCSLLAALKFWLPDETSSQRPRSLTPAGQRLFPLPGGEGKGEGEPHEISERPVRGKGELNPSNLRPSAPSADVPAHLKDWKFFWLALALFICALFSKTTIIPLPAVILLLVWWKRRKITWPDVRPLLPFLVIGFAIGLITHRAEQHLGAHGKDFQISLVDRCLIAGRSFWFYLEKLIWPHPVMFVYPRWKIAPSPALAWLSLLAFIPLLGILWLQRKSWGRPTFVALAYFGGMLFLMLGFFNIYFFLYSFVSDHFQYEACMGPIALFAAVVTLAFNRWAGSSEDEVPSSHGHGAGPTASPSPGGEGRSEGGLASRSSGRESALTDSSLATRHSSLSYAIFSACLLTVLGTLTWKQCHMYQNIETLWGTTAIQNPKAFLAHNNLGDIFMAQGQTDAAIQQYKISLGIREDAEACHNLGNALLQTGKPAQAAVYFQKALELKPDDPITCSDVGNLFLETGHTDAAIQYFQKAMQIEPDLPIVCYDLGNAYLQKGQMDLAIKYWQKAVDLQPDYPMPHNNLGNALLLKGQVAQAIQHWEAALKYEPDLVSAQVNLAWVLATCPQPWLRNGAEAVALAERADKLSNGENPGALRSLAAAYAETGRFSDAVATAQQALQLARGNSELAATLQEQLKCYQRNQPFRDTSLTAQ